MVSPESEALRSCVSALNETLASGNASLNWFATKLYEKKFIGCEVCMSAMGQGSYEKASNLTMAVVSRVSNEPRSFPTFLAILQENAALNTVTNKLLEKYAVPLVLSNVTRICDILKEAGFQATEWESLASRLGIGDPGSIRDAHPRHPALCLRETIRQWLHNERATSWKKLATEVSKVNGYGAGTTQTILLLAGGTTMTDSSIVAENTTSYAVNQYGYLQLEDISTMLIEQERVPASPVGRSQSLQHFPIQRAGTESNTMAKVLDQVMLDSKNKDTRILGLEEELRKSRAELKREREKWEREREKLKQSLTEHQQYIEHLEKQYQDVYQQSRTLPRHMSEGRAFRRGSMTLSRKPPTQSCTDGLTPKIAVSRSTTQTLPSSNPRLRDYRSPSPSPSSNPRLRDYRSPSPSPSRIPVPREQKSRRPVNTVHAHGTLPRAKF